MQRTPTLMRRNMLQAATALALCGASIVTTAHAHDFRAGQLVIDHPYATPSLTGTPNGAAYFRSIRNRGTAPDRLVSASTAVAERVELHEMTTEGNIMRMREVPAIDLPAGQEVQLRHGQRYHLMLINLRQPLKVGDRFDLTLKFEKAGETTVKAWVQQPRAGSSQSTHADHKH
ncbi:MAG: copper chaperone PCu(A)C [Acidovorax sp.]|uniref:copper chaperone PCu(A)C n=1 Tax=Acidovorax sp. TaxID=1872122 RepID=UPI00391C2588